MRPEPKQFTKENPCTKKDLWNCFVGRSGFVAVQVYAAEAKIGINAPKYMRRKEYLKRVSRGNKDLYVLTEEGKTWLLRGIKSYLINHPEEVENVKYPPEID